MCGRKVGLLAKKFSIEVVEKWCKGCGLCIAICPKKVLELNDRVSAKACVRMTASAAVSATISARTWQSQLRSVSSNGSERILAGQQSHSYGRYRRRMQIFRRLPDHPVDGNHGKSCPKSFLSWAANSSRWKTKSEASLPALGASIAGKKAMTASSGPGISLKQELLGYGYIAKSRS